MAVNWFKISEKILIIGYAFNFRVLYRSGVVPYAFNRKNMTKIVQEKIVFQDVLTLEKGQLQDETGNMFSRVRVNRQDASCVLVFNIDTNKIVLTQQFRYGAAPKTHAHLLEIVAGRVDAGEEPLATAIRETEEEIGYRVTENNLSYLVTCFSSPAYTAERYHIYFAQVTHADKKSKGGGLKNENESIEVVEMESVLFKEHILAGKFLDAKTYVAGQQAMLKNLI